MEPSAEDPIVRAAWWWIDRWRSSPAYTAMTLAEMGAYRNLLDELWLRDGLLPLDERTLARACGDPVEWPNVRAKVLAEFRLTEEGYRHDTHDEVASESRRRADRQRRYRDRNRNVTHNVTPNVTQSPSPSPSLSPDQEEEKETPPSAPSPRPGPEPAAKLEQAAAARRPRLSSNPSVARVQARWRDGPGRGAELPATPKHGGWAGLSKALADCLAAKGVGPGAETDAAIDRAMTAFLGCREEWVVAAGWPLHMLTGNWERWWNTDHEARPAAVPQDRTRAAIEEAARIMGMTDGPEDRARAGGPLRNADGDELRRFAARPGGHRDRASGPGDSNRG